MMDLFYTALITTFVLFLSPALTHASLVRYKGEAIFKAETTMPGVTIEGSSKKFKSLTAEFSDDLQTLKKVSAELDAETLKTGIDLRDQHMYEKVFLVLSAKERPALLSLSMEKADCLKEGKGLNCSGDGHFLFGKKSFSKKISLKFDENLNVQTAFNVGLKDLSLEIPGYLGIEVEDSISVNMKASRE